MKINILERIKKYKKDNFDINKIYLQKNGKYSNITIKLSRKLVTKSELYKKADLEQKISNFISVMIRDFSCFPFERFKNNFSTLLINDELSKRGFSCYKNDKIKKSINFKNDNSLFHEFLHFSSDKSDNEKTIIGFEYSVDKFNRFGFGLDEAYTTYLEEKYFPSDMNSEFYFPLSYVAEKLEELLGREYMENIYFNGTVFDLMKKLTELSNEKEAKNFIKQLDRIYQKFELCCYSTDYNESFLLFSQIENLTDEVTAYIERCSLYKSKNVKN